MIEQVEILRRGKWVAVGKGVRHHIISIVNGVSSNDEKAVILHKLLTSNDVKPSVADPHVASWVIRVGRTVYRLIVYSDSSKPPSFSSL